MGVLAVEGAVALLGDAVDGLLAADLSPLGSAGVVEMVRAVEVQRRRLDAVDQRLLAELGERALTGELGRLSAQDLLVTELRVAPGEARRRVAHARDMGPRRALSGEPLPPIFPSIAQAQTEGAISAAHATLITDAVTELSPDTAAAAAPAAERYLTDAARHENPTQLRATALTLLAHLNPDGIAPQHDRAERRRAFSLHPCHDGTTTPTGSLTGETAAVWQTLLNALATPTPAQDGTPDHRNAAQRRHDALLEAGLRLLRSGTLPDCGGVPVTILARTTLTDLTATAATAATAANLADSADLADPAAPAPARTARPATANGVAVTEHGDLLTLRALLRLANEADIVPVVLDDLGGVLAYGRTRRLASPGQRRALAVRDGGCCFPGCDRPPSWAEAHHITEWNAGGPTNLDNLCLLCSHHHRTFEPEGWSVQMTNGRPEWIPPPWLDPEQKPRHNTTHHLDDIHFTA